MKYTKNKNDFEILKSIMHKITDNLGIDRGLRELTFVNLWPELIGPKFKDKTKVISVSRRQNIDVVIVAVSSSSVSQELTLLKDMIIKRLSGVSLTLKFNIKDILFTTKYWIKEDILNLNIKNSDTITHFFKKNPSDKELEDIKIPENIMEIIFKAIEKHDYTSVEIRDRILITITKDIKTQIWRKNNGFPSCEKCGISIEYYSENMGFLCPSCKY